MKCLLISLADFHLQGRRHGECPPSFSVQLKRSIMSGQQEEETPKRFIHSFALSMAQPLLVISREDNTLNKHYTTIAIRPSSFRATHSTPRTQNNTRIQTARHTAEQNFVSTTAAAGAAQYNISLAKAHPFSSVTF